MPLLTDRPTSPHPFRSRWTRWAPLALTLAASAAWAQPTESPEPDYATEAKSAEPSGIVVHVPPGQQRQLIIEDVERVRVHAPEVAEVALGETNQLMVQGLRQGASEVLVWRLGRKHPLSVRVEVAQ